MTKPQGNNTSISYYDNAADDFVASTKDVDMSAHRARFLARMPLAGSILDLGCGSGRDSLAFLQSGYDVTSVDGSQAMVEATSSLTGQPAKKLRFDELECVDEYDGVWACASLLHVPRNELGGILRKVLRALRPAGVLYVSFKVGDGERVVVDGRHFTDFTQGSFLAWTSGHAFADIVELWETGDVREGRSHEGWVNAILTASPSVE